MQHDRAPQPAWLTTYHTVRHALLHLVAPVLLLVAPQRCGGCEAEGSAFCDACRAAALASAPPQIAARELPRGCDAAGVVGSYLSPLGVALRTLKFHAAPELADPLGALLATTVRTVQLELGGSEPPVLVPIPTDPARLRERGFDHAALLAASAAAATGLWSAPILERTRSVPPLHTLSKVERQRAMERAIALRTGVELPATVILVDDIWTSGATFRAAAEALRAAGCARIGAVAVAREPLAAVGARQ